MIDHDYFPDIPYTHREQFWIHQNTINSLLNVAGPSFFPYHLVDKSISSQLMQVFPEVVKYYGKNVQIGLDVALAARGNKSPVQMNMKDGIVLGNLDDSVTTIGLVCSNETTTNETAVTIEMHLQAKVNFTMKNVIFYPFPSNITVFGANATNDKIGMYSHDYTTLFQSIFQDFATTWNLQNKAGIPIQVLFPQPGIGMIGGLLQNSTMTPFVSDGWMYAGFSMYADMPVKSEAPVLTFMQE